MVEQVLIKKGIDISTLSKLINLSKEHLYILLGDRFLEYDIIKFIGKQVGHDFSNEFPELRNSLS